MTSVLQKVGSSVAGRVHAGSGSGGAGKWRLDPFDERPSSVVPGRQRGRQPATQAEGIGSTGPESCDTRQPNGSGMGIQMRRGAVSSCLCASCVALTFASAAASPDARPLCAAGGRGSGQLPRMPIRWMAARFMTVSLPCAAILTGDIRRHFIPENFRPAGKGTREPTGEPGLTIIRDRYGIPHLRGKTRSALMFGSGWVTAEDRCTLLLQLGRGPAAGRESPTCGDQRLLAGDERPLIRAQSRLRASRHPRAKAVGQDLRVQGSADRPRREELRAWSNCLLAQRPASTNRPGP